MDQKDKKLIKNLTRALDKFWESPRRTFWRQFYLGIGYGLGATIGVAITLTILGYILRSLGGLPFIGEWLTEAGQTLPKP
jgi:uncharacterized BrkB/YihY/UPF0761 family membrane protein